MPATKPALVETAAPPVHLEPADYWHLMALERDWVLAKMQARVAVATAAGKHAALMAELAAKYPGLEAENAHYTADDATHTLTLVRP